MQCYINSVLSGEPYKFHHESNALHLIELAQTNIMCLLYIENLRSQHNFWNVFIANYKIVKIRLILFIDEALSLVTGDGVCNLGSAGSIADLANAAILICFVIRLLNKEINNAS